MLCCGVPRVSKLHGDERDPSVVFYSVYFSEIDFLLMLVTLLFCVFLKLEWGIMIGIALNLVILLYFSARPSVRTEIEQVR